ncbi:MAG: phosphatase PAP2 family protein, partial [Vicinamibacterales bacterium]
MRRLGKNGLAMAGVVALTLVLTAVAAGDGALPGDLALARAVQRLDYRAADAIDQVGYWLGAVWVVVAVGGALAMLLALTRRWAEAAVMLGVVLARALNPLLKWLIASPRPTAEEVRVSELASNYGFPSGHVMGVVLVYGAGIALAQRLVEPRWPRLALQSLCAVAILITCFARVHSGAHWPSDVLGAWLWGSLAAIAIVTIAQRPWNVLSLPATRPARTIN